MTDTATHIALILDTLFADQTTSFRNDVAAHLKKRLAAHIVKAVTINPDPLPVTGNRGRYAYAIAVATDPDADSHSLYIVVPYGSDQAARPAPKPA